jgi:hypothetical protein
LALVSQSAVETGGVVITELLYMSSIAFIDSGIS